MESLANSGPVKWLSTRLSAQLGLDIESSTTHSTVLSLLVGLIIFTIANFVTFRISENRRMSGGRGRAYTLPIPEPARPHWKGRRVELMSIHDPARSEVIRCLCPATGQLLDEVRADTAEQIDAKVHRAHIAWSGISVAQNFANFIDEPVATDPAAISAPNSPSMGNCTGAFSSATAPTSGTVAGLTTSSSTSVTHQVSSAISSTSYMPTLENPTFKRGWKDSTFEQRAEVLKTMLRYLSEHQQDVCRVACRDTGKTMIDAALGEVMVTLEKIAWILKNGADALAPSGRSNSASWLMGYKRAEVRYEPLGVVCAMVSWNYPLHNLLGPVAAALYAGDAIVVKCSEQVVWSSQFFVGIARRALELHGHDPDVVQLVACWPEHADALTQNPLVKHITFIGSRPVAHLVAKAAAKPLTPVVVELGGKDPLIVLDDYTKIDAVASIIMRGVFQSAGQNCIGVERVLLHTKVHDVLVRTLSERVTQLRVGAALDEVAAIDMGALSNAAHLDRLEALVADAVAQGATLVAGGRRYAHPKYPLGIYFEPTMLSGVTPRMRIAQEEVFGPILLVMVPFRSADEAIALANMCDFGLGASVFGKSAVQLDYVVDRLRCGNVAINDFATYHLCQLPFGGVDGSGYGKFGGVEGLRGLSLEKSVVLDRFPFISTYIPRALDYPILSPARAWGLVRSINDMGYATSWWGRFKGIRRSVSLSVRGPKEQSP